MVTGTWAPETNTPMWDSNGMQLAVVQIGSTLDLRHHRSTPSFTRVAGRNDISMSTELPGFTSIFGLSIAQRPSGRTRGGDSLSGIFSAANALLAGISVASAAASAIDLSTRRRVRDGAGLDDALTIGNDPLSLPGQFPYSAQYRSCGLSRVGPI